METLTFTCINCRAPFTYRPASKLERDCLLAVGACCDACEAVAAEFFESDEYRAFEESEA